MSNRGYHFEFITEQALKELGHTVQDRHFLKIQQATISPADQKQIETIKRIFKDVSPQVFRIANPSVDNTQDMSSDFISPELGISCKVSTSVVKAPSIGSVFNRLTGKNLSEQILLEYKNIREYREDFFQVIKKDRKTLYNLIAQKEFDLLKEINFSKEQVQRLYCFLMGKEKPVIIQANTKHITAYDLRKFNFPDAMELFFEDNQLRIRFSNGVCLKKRFKTGKNSTTKGYWYSLFKEEWKIISTPEWESVKEIFYF